MLQEQMTSLTQPSDLTKSGGKIFDRDLLSNYPNAKYVHAINYTDTAQDTIVVWGNDFLDPHPNPTGAVLADVYVQSTGANTRPHGQRHDVLRDRPQRLPLQLHRPRHQFAVYVKVAHAANVGQNAASSVSGWPLLLGETNYAAAPSVKDPLGNYTGIGSAATDACVLPANSLWSGYDFYHGQQYLQRRFQDNQ